VKIMEVQEEVVGKKIEVLKLKFHSFFGW